MYKVHRGLLYSYMYMKCVSLGIVLQTHACTTSMATSVAMLHCPAWPAVSKASWDWAFEHSKVSSSNSPQS